MHSPNTNYFSFNEPGLLKKLDGHFILDINVKLYIGTLISLIIL